MKYNSVIIGGGLAGFTCGLQILKAGLTCAVFSGGANALHFSSGSIDLLGRHPGLSVVYSPMEFLADFISAHPEHPYAKCGIDLITDSLHFFRRQISSQGLEFYSNGQNNHFHITALGGIKPTFLSPPTVFNDRIKAAFENRSPLAILTFEGFRDFQPALAAANLAKLPMFRDSQIITGRIKLPTPRDVTYAHPDLKSIDICRFMEEPQAPAELAKQIMQVAAPAHLVALPACLGLERHQQIVTELQDLTGKLIYESPTLPPSILGLRLDQALKKQFTDLGGILISGDRVIGGEIMTGRLDHIHTRNYGRARIKADSFVLAPGSFFSGGLTSFVGQVSEPIFDLAVEFDANRSNWSSPKFLDPSGHAFLSFGLHTDRDLRPRNRQGQIISNLYCAGAVLAGYDPIREGTGGGVAIATGYKAARQIIGRQA
ncbi:MAG: glycerol-3-phosphate dehydrogenase subunit GlpB [Deltaproteobacteria bacterium]|nr:glycerol-3-phosphate dehydrogenase subunit GlpB [Deltaproteobacteria bacterium]